MPKKIDRSDRDKDVPASVLREYALPNGGKIVSIRSDTFRSAVAAANHAIRRERSLAAGRRERAGRT